MRKILEKRLIRLSGDIYRLTNHLTVSFASEHLANQIIRSSTGAALNYGEAQGAESYKDFIHKTSLVLKELKETYINLLIMQDIMICGNSNMLASIIDECNQLISIFHKTVITAKSKNKIK